MTHRDSDQRPWDYAWIRQRVGEWFRKGKAYGFKYLLICQDTFDIGDTDMGLYPHYSSTLEEARKFQAKQLTGIDLLREVLNLEADLESQLSKSPKIILDELEPIITTQNISDSNPKFLHQTWRDNPELQEGDTPLEKLPRLTLMLNSEIATLATNCHLIEQAKAGQLSADMMNDGTIWLKSILESNDFEVGIMKCTKCGQLRTI